MNLLLDEPLVIKVLIAIYLVWMISCVGYTMNVTIRTLLNLEQLTDRRRYPRTWFLNMWIPRTKALWFIVSTVLAIICPLTLFFQAMLR